MKILLLGKNGMLGKAILNAFSGNARQISNAPPIGDIQLFALGRAECDVTKISDVEKAVRQINPGIIINATGYTNVDKAEAEKKEAFTVNAEGVSNIVRVAKPSKITFVHFSTDYVFDGEKSEGYDETDIASPLCAYGASKAEGEKIIAENLQNYFIIRTAWLYGPGGRNFVDTMLDLARKQDTLRVVNDQIGNPTYTLDLAEATFRLLAGKYPFGIYHIVNDGKCSWYDFAVEIFNQLGIPKKIEPITSSELSRPAKRPKFSILKSSKFDKLRPWKQALTDYLKNKTLIL